jgi:hypothetical protein
MTDAPKPRASHVAANALRGTGEHRLVEGAFALIGLAIVAFDAYLMLQHPPAGVVDQIAHGFWLVVGLALIPGAATRAASGIARIGGAAAKAWRAKDGGGPTP